MKRSLEDKHEKELKKRKILYIQTVLFLPCDVCQNPVYDYSLCISPHVYCSVECFEILVLTYFCSFSLNPTFDMEE